MIILENSIGYVMDVDASRVIEAIRATGVQPTHAMMNYAHTICSGLKGTGMWQNSVALYGMLGGTAASHKFNWKDLRDLDEAFRLVFNGSGWIHNSSGILTTTSGDYVNTNLIPSTALSLNDAHASFYSSTTNPNNNYNIGLNSEQPSKLFRLSVNAANQFIVELNALGGVFIPNVANKKGFAVAYINTSGEVNLYKDPYYQKSIKTATAISNSSILLLADYSFANGTYATKTNVNMSFTSIGDGLTDQQAITSSQVITQAQNILNRA